MKAVCLGVAFPSIRFPLILFCNFLTLQVMSHFLLIVCPLIKSNEKLTAIDSAFPEIQPPCAIDKL